MVVFIIVALVLAALIGGVTYSLWKKAHPPYTGPAAYDIARAVQIVWVQAYKQSIKTLPLIQWITGKALNCYSGTGWVDSIGRCVAGETFADQRLCKIAWVNGELLSDAAFAHELCHYYLSITGQDPEPNHDGPAFASGGIKDQANDALRSAGL